MFAKARRQTRSARPCIEAPRSSLWSLFYGPCRAASGRALPLDTSWTQTKGSLVPDLSAAQAARAEHLDGQAARPPGRPVSLWFGGGGAAFASSLPPKGNLGALKPKGIVVCRS